MQVHTMATGDLAVEDAGDPRTAGAATTVLPDLLVARHGSGSPGADFSTNS
jgi:hypothetical protein